MRMISPQLDAPQVQIATEQEQFFELTAALVTNPEYGVPVGRMHNTVMLAYRLTEYERQLVRDGADIYIALLTGGGAMQPILPIIGKEIAAAAFRIGVRI